MNKDTILSLVRTVLTGLGAFLIGKNFLGSPLDDVLWQGVVGVIITLGSAVWAIFDKTLTQEKIESAIRQVVIVIGGLLVAAGKLSDQTLQLISGLTAIISSFLWSLLNRQKAEAVAEGEIAVLQLKGADNAKTFAPTLRKAS